MECSDKSINHKTMKKLLLIFAAGLFIFSPAESKAQAVTKGTVLIDAYYGFPNWTKSLLQTSYANSGSETNISINGIGPVGGRIEYLLGEKIGLGVDVNYTSASVSWKESGTNDVGQPVVYDHKTGQELLRAMAAFSWHFVGSDEFDAYLSFGAGYRNKTYAYETNEPGFIDSETKGLIPLAVRLAVGGRYFFTDNIGAGIELGLGGGGNVRGGLAVKF